VRYHYIEEPMRRQVAAPNHGDVPRGVRTIYPVGIDSQFPKVFCIRRDARTLQIQLR